MSLQHLQDVFCRPETSGDGPGKLQPPFRKSGHRPHVSSILDLSFSIFVVLFSSCLHNLCSISAAIVVSKLIVPVGAIEMTRCVLLLPLLDVTGERLSPHALGCKHSPTSANSFKIWQQQLLANALWAAFAIMLRSHVGSDKHEHTYTHRIKKHTPAEQTLDN